MVVTIWWAIGTEREGDFAGKNGYWAHTLVIMVFPAKKVLPGRCIHSRDSRTRSDSA